MSNNNNWGLGTSPNTKAVMNLISKIRNEYDIEAIKELISKMSISNLNQVIDGNTALMTASMIRNRPIVELLLDHGADINIRDKDGKTALMLMYSHSLNEDNDITRLLLERGADTNIRDKNGKTALMYVLRSPTLEDDLPLLLEHGADINNQDKMGKTALMYATEMGDVIAVILLLKYGANKDIRNGLRQTARDIAIARNRPDMVAVIDNYLLLRNTTTAKALNTIFNIQTKKAHDAKKELPLTLPKDPMSLVSSYLSGVNRKSLNNQLLILQNKMYGTYIPDGPAPHPLSLTPKEEVEGILKRKEYSEALNAYEEKLSSSAPVKSRSSGGRRTKRHTRSKPEKKHRLRRAITKRRVNLNF